MKMRIMCGTFFAACAASAGALTMPQTTPRGGSPVLTFASLRDVTVTDDFWAPRYERWRTKTIPDVLAKLCGRSRIEANFRLAAVGARKGHVGPYFYDGLLYETIRGAADYLVREPDASLEKRLDALIDLIVSAQCPDGYLNTRVQVSDPSQRWGDNGGCALDQHEIYNAGCLVEAGLHYYRATGKAKLLGAGIRFNALINDCDETATPSGQRPSATSSRRIRSPKRPLSRSPNCCGQIPPPPRAPVSRRSVRRITSRSSASGSRTTATTAACQTGRSSDQGRPSRNARR